MPESSERTLGERVNTWVQVGAILLGGIWALYTFIYKEIVQPRAVPANVSAELIMTAGTIPTQLSETGSDLFIPITLQMSAVNATARRLTLMPSVFIVYGQSLQGDDRDTLTEAPEHRFDDVAAEILERHTTVRRANIVATGLAFPDEFLKPAEASKKTVVIYVPVGRYDVIDAVMVVPTARAAGEFELLWTYNKERDAMTPAIYDLADGKRTQITPEQASEYDDDRIQLTAARSQVPLARR